MKKLLTALLACILSVGCLFGLTACGDGDGNGEYSETFKGVASEQTYSTKEEAALQFVNNESTYITSEYVTHEVKSYTKLSDLTKAEIAALNLSESDRANLQSAEKVEVSFVRTHNPEVGEDDPENGTNKLYVLDMGGEYKYYVPLPEVGDRLTVSYLDSVLNIENYYNCTAEKHYKETNATEESAPYGGNTTRTKENTYTTKVDKKSDFIYTSATETVKTVYNPLDKDIFKEYYEDIMPEIFPNYYIQHSYSYKDWFLLDSEEYIWQVTYADKDYRSTSYEIYGIDDFIFQYTNLFLASYYYIFNYVKTEYGFTVDEEITSRYSGEDYFKYEVYVTNGTVSKIYSEAKYSHEEKSHWGTDITTTNIVQEIKFYDFGKTKIGVPKQVKDLLRI